jgi:hypothetical protein
MAKGRGESKLAIIGAVTVALAIAGMMLVKEPLRSSRPVVTGVEMKHLTGEQLVRTRLWEDPLEAVQRAMNEQRATGPTGTQQESAGPSRSEGSTLDIVDRVRPIRKAIVERVTKDQRITVLLVTTVGGPYVEDRESRIRDRYAIGSALGVACYVPEDEGHISFIAWEAGGASGLPFEWYRQRKTRDCGGQGERANSVLVIWLPDEAMSNGFFGTLTSLSQAIICEEEKGKSRCKLTEKKGVPLVHLNQTLQQHVTFKILGPRSSSSFRSLLQEAGYLYPDPHEGIGVWPNRDGKIDLYSPWATAMKGLLAYELKSENEKGDRCGGYEECEQDFHRKLDHAGIRVAYSIGSDDALFETLIEELERRQVKLGWNGIILIGEWDSFYGRVLPIEFQAAVCVKLSKLTGAELININVSTETKSRCSTLPRAIDLQIQRPLDYRDLDLYVFRYSYLSGLDGEVPGDDKVKAGRGEKPKTNGTLKETQAEIAAIERPEGTSQLDYIRALAARIKSEAEDAKAIGIMGTDPYDALLILKALRSEFPRAVFFTTALDARYLHFSEYPRTRNMVIASHFGLELDGRIQRDIPPFRSSYQTATYFATLRAVDHVRCSMNGAGTKVLPSCSEGYRVSLTHEKEMFDARAQPRLFEVGRHGAVDLSVVKTEGVRSIHVSRPDLQRTSVDLKTGQLPHRQTVLVLTGLCLLILGVVVWSQQRLWQWACRNARALGIAGVSLLVIAVAFWALDGPAYLMANHDEGEPFSWTSGVSIWPTELLRLLAAILSVIFLLKGSRDLKLNGDQLTENFSFPSGKDLRIDFNLAVCWANLQRVYHPNMNMPALTVDQVWSQYREAGAQSQRWGRVIAILGVVACVMVPLWWIYDEDVVSLCRGTFSCTIDEVMSSGSVLLMVILNLYVFDAVMLCRRWIGWLGKSTGQWSDQFQRKYASQYGTDTDHGTEFDRLKDLACIDLIAQRTHVVNKLIRYPFIALLVMIVARNNYFDMWSFPLLLIVVWTLNILMALGGALLLFQSAAKAKDSALTTMGKKLIQVMGVGKDQDYRVKQTQQIIEEIESNQKGAFMPFYQQPAVESGLYGLVALLQYWYLG